MNEQVPPSPPPITSPSKACGLAVASLVFGILGLMCVLPVVSPILALTFGIVALNQISKSGGGLRGRGQAIAGLVLGGVGMLMIPIVAAMLLPALAQAKGKAQRIACMNNMRQIGMAMGMYAEEHDGKIPREFTDLKLYASNLDKLLICPGAKDRTSPSYRIVLAGKKWNGPETMDAVVLTEQLGNHRRGRNALYGDGHVEFVTAPTSE
ncbi:MAG TPA: DUF4190 domain-containing protein [Verrucomicrobiae bacterium]|nr:DUF4190 domain-containing protein [Verrucomicrobiae bacterium]